MSDERGCTISIDNSNNQYNLVLANISYQQGSFSSSVNTGYTILAGALPDTTTNPALVLSNDSGIHGADITFTWSTGPDNMDMITMNIQNTLAGDNIAQLTITNSNGSSLYGTSYLYASSGSGSSLTPFQRDAAPNSGSPMSALVYIVQNAYGNQNPGNFLPGINKVVMLMLENRSLDHLLGQLYTDTNLAKAFYPATNTTPYNGIPSSPPFENTLVVGSTTYPPMQPSPIVASDDPTTPDPDPGESFKYVNNQLFYPNYDYSAPPTMGGFLYDYYNNSGILHGGDGYPACNQIMGFYTSEQLPVISGLAAQYAISDAWFCSVPSQTYVNRAFSIAGTSYGTVDNPGDALSSPNYPMRTIFNVLMDSGFTSMANDWSIFVQDSTYQEDGNSFVTFAFDAMQTTPCKNMVQSMDNFFTLTQPGGAGLPSFSYLEPAWYWGVENGTDYHPTANLLPGEVELNNIYQALAGSDDWNNTLFIVTFDEHGGTMDHQPPPNAQVPDFMTYSDDGLTFNFDRLGVRVPTLLISPQIAQGTVFRSPDAQAFDHTSLVRTILGFMGIDVSKGVMGLRAAVAPDFSGVLSGGEVVNPGMINITPYTQSDAVKAKNANLPFNDLQKQLLYMVAHSLADGVRGSEEHVKVWNELKALKSINEMKDYVAKKVTTRKPQKQKGE